MARILVLLVVLLMVGAHGAASGADVPEVAQEALARAGVPVYADAAFCIGSPEAGLRFATDEDPAEVRAWYVEQLPDWSLYDDAKLGLWVLYDGPPDLRGFASVVGFNHVAVQANPNLPEWHDLPAATTTEIMIMATHAAAPATGGALAVVPPREGWTAPDLPRLTADDGFVGTLHRGQDMDSETERYYFYLQDDAYNEHVVAFEDEVPEGVAARLDALADGDRTVRVTGDVFVDESMGTSLFDRSQELRILAVE